MYTTQNNRWRDTKIERRIRQLQIDIYNLEQQIERYLDREEEKVGTNRCIQLRTINREEEEAATNRSIQLRTLDREIPRQR